MATICGACVKLIVYAVFALIGGLALYIYYSGRYEVWAIGAVPERAAREKAWGSSSTGAQWLGAQCGVLEVGIAYRGGCDGNNLTKDLPFLPDDFTECPGTVFCADEGGICKGCGGGDVLFADYRGWSIPEFKDLSGIPDFRFVMGDPVGDLSNVLHDAPDEVPCRQQPKGPFKGDPEPGSTKACFCTPRRISKLLEQKGPLDWRGERCSVLADRAFASSTGEVGLAASTSRSSKGSGLKASNAMALPDGWCDDYEGILYHSDLVLLPWALVEVVETDPFAGAGKPKLRCAYKYGAPAVSLEDARPRPGGSGEVRDWSHLTGSYRDWSDALKAGDKLPCSVRSDSILQDSSCSVALSAPAHAGVDDPPAPSVLLAPFYLLEICFGFLLSFCFCSFWFAVPCWCSLPLAGLWCGGIAALQRDSASAREPGYQRLDDEAGLGEGGAQGA